MSEQTEIRLGVSQGVDWRLIVTEIGQNNVLISLEQPASETHFGAIHGYQQRTVHQAIVVPAEHRVAVALALLGDRDALVEQIAEGIWRGKGFGRTYPTFAGRPEVIKDLYRRDARAVLAAIGGGGEGEG